MDIRDKLLMREGTISDLVPMLDAWFNKANDFYPMVAVRNLECDRGGKVKWDCCLDKSFCGYDMGDLMSYLFDLDVNGWSVQVAYLSWDFDFHLCSICLERFTD